MVKPDFDYHLEPSERTSIEKLVPLHQAKIHLAMRANLVVNGSKYNLGSVCLSEHMMTLAKKKLFGKSFSLLSYVHLFDVILLKTIDEYTVEFQTNDATVTVYTGEAMRLARTILRDYILSTSLIPPQKRFKFSPHDASYFPPFSPPISPSQAFQFTYNAFCSKLDATYCHEAVQFYHKNLTTNQGIINMNQLPLNLMETNLRKPMDLNPFFQSLKYCPYVFGLCCTNVNRPDLFSAMAPLVETNCTLHFISLENCNIDRGIDELAVAIQKNKNIKISYWDFSGNPFQDACPLMAAFASYPTPIFFMDLGTCNLSADATELLFKALEMNKNLWKLSSLHINGAKITDKSAQIFKNHLRIMSEHGYNFLRSIDFGSMASGVHHILEGLVSYPQPIEVLRIQNSKIKANSFNALLSIISQSDTLHELDISGTGLNVDQVNAVIKNIGNNSALAKVSFRFGALGINGDKLDTVFQQLRKYSEKWSCFSIDKSGLGVEDVKFLVRALPKFSNVTGIRLNENFHHSQKGIGDALSELIDLKQLKAIRIRGCKSNGIEDQIIPVLNHMSHNNHVKSLDIQNNYFHDDGYEAIGRMIKSNSYLCQLKYDGGRPKNVESIINLLDILKKSDTMLSCKLPTDDAYKSIARHKSAQRTKFEDLLSQKQDQFYIKLLTNQVNKGLTSFMALKGVKQLDTMIEELAAQLTDVLGEASIHQHSAVGALLGLKLPFEGINGPSKNDTGEKGAVLTVSAPGADEYESNEACQQVIEQVGEDLTNLTTLQFNSLAIKRSQGSLIRRAKEKAKYSDSYSDDDYYDDYSDEDSPQPKRTMKGVSQMPSPKY